jgi:gliding motility-associated-like protein
VAAQTWDWNLGDSNFSNNFSDTHTYGTSGIFTVGLKVTYVNGCQDSIQHSVLVWELPSINSTVVQPSCYNTSDGAIDVTPVKGQTPFNYNWNGVPNSTEDQFNISSGNYALIYTDANGCVGSENFVLNNPPQILLASQIQDVRCFGESNGAISIDVSGGNAPFTYQWDNGKTDASLSNLSYGTYQLTVTGSDNCSLDTQIIVSQPNQITIHILPVDTLELGETIDLVTSYSINYGNPTFSWTPSVGLSCTDCQSPQAGPFHTTTYTVTLTDSAGCKASDTYTLIVHGEHQLYVPNAFTPNGDGNNDKFNGFTKGFKTYRIRVFNRWGEKVYDGSQPGNNADVNDIGWDGVYKGELHPPGVYVFEVAVEFLDEKQIQKAGSVTLIR